LLLLTQAEKAAWEVAQELDLDLVTILRLPNLILGPLTSTRSGYSRSLAQELLQGKRFEDLFLFYGIHRRPGRRSGSRAGSGNAWRQGAPPPFPRGAFSKKSVSL